MIVLGNAEFATGMKLVGIRNTHVVREREKGMEVVKGIDKNEFILANVSVIKMIPELEEFRNLVSVPDDVEEFKSTKDLSNIIKSAVGIELEL